MKVETVQVFRAFDGKQFEQASDCKAYEREFLQHRFVGLTLDQVEAAVVGNDPDLAEAFEQFGRQLAVKRRAGGALRRHRKANGEATERSPPAVPAISDASR